MLYQYAICPFCNKVKAVLDFLDLPYEVVEVSPMSKSQLKSWTEYRKVPVARVGGDEVQDSAVILTHILDRAVAAGQQVPVGFAAEGTEEWVTWADAELAVLLFPNITRTKTKETAERGRCVCMCVCVLFSPCVPYASTDVSAVHRLLHLYPGSTGLLTLLSGETFGIAGNCSTALKK